MVNQILSREEFSRRMRENASTELKAKIEDWAPDLADRICIYTTGSFGRDDASKHSDLDIFIVCREDFTKRRLLSGLEEILLLADVVHVNKKLKLPDLDGDGGFLKVHPISQYLVGLGKPSDDAQNTFTGRLLLLLESKPLFGERVYKQAIKECVDRYWIDYADHSESFLPAFLMNDVLRFWRTLCVNYEVGEDQVPSKRRAKNYKLKHSRLLTCFSAILGLQVAFRKEATISQATAIQILERTPLQRLETCRVELEGKEDPFFERLFEMYEMFLERTDRSKPELYDWMDNPENYKKALIEARNFGDTFFELVNSIATGSKGDDWRFLRYITI